jgi:hypothetical protein
MGAGSCHKVPPVEAQPNIILIVSDDQSFDHYSPMTLPTRTESPMKGAA